MIRRLCLTLPCLLLCGAGMASPRPERRLDAPRGELRAIIYTDQDSAESSVEIWHGGKRQFRWSGLSAETGHGWTVEKAAWTRDGKFLVFSLTNAQGHQPWHFPTFVYRRSTSTLLDLETVQRYRSSTGITTPGFRLLKNDVVATQMLGTGNEWIPVHLLRAMGQGVRSK